MAEDGTQLLNELMRFKPEGMTANAWAVSAGVSRTIWSDLKRHGNPSRRTLSKLLEAAGSSLAEFEALRVGADAAGPIEGAGLADPGRAWRPAGLATLPLFRTVPSGARVDPDQAIPILSIDHAQVIDRLTRPASLAVDQRAYAVLISVESMWPRFRSGRRLAISPSASVGVGDDVLALLDDVRGAVIGELRYRSADAVGLRQFNPPAEFEIAAADIEAIQKVIGELI
jgi:hypothetical protein